MDNLTITPIEKEEIKALSFPKEEVLTSDSDKEQREINLKRALSLGNLEHGKVRIIFVDNEGHKEVETTVWGLTRNDVILKVSTIIPLNRILKVS